MIKTFIPCVAKTIPNVDIALTMKNAHAPDIANANRFVYKDLSTIIVFVPVEVEHISSSLVRELHTFGRDVNDLLPEGITLGDYLNFEE